MELDKIIVRGAKEHNLKNVNVEIPITNWLSLRDFRVREKALLPLIRYMPRDSADTLKAFRLMQECFSVKWTSQM